MLKENVVPKLRDNCQSQSLLFTAAHFTTHFSLNMGQNTRPTLTIRGTMSQALALSLNDSLGLVSLVYPCGQVVVILWFLVYRHLLCCFYRVLPVKTTVFYQSKTGMSSDIALDPRPESDLDELQSLFHRLPPLHYHH